MPLNPMPLNPAVRERIGARLIAILQTPASAGSQTPLAAADRLDQAALGQLQDELLLLAEQTAGVAAVRAAFPYLYDAPARPRCVICGEELEPHEQEAGRTVHEGACESAARYEEWADREYQLRKEAGQS